MKAVLAYVVLVAGLGCAVSARSELSVRSLGSLTFAAPLIDSASRTPPGADLSLELGSEIVSEGTQARAVVEFFSLDRETSLAAAVSLEEAWAGVDLDGTDFRIVAGRYPFQSVTDGFAQPLLELIPSVGSVDGAGIEGVWTRLAASSDGASDVDSAEVQVGFSAVFGPPETLYLRGSAVFKPFSLGIQYRGQRNSPIGIPIIQDTAFVGDEQRVAHRQHLGFSLTVSGPSLDVSSCLLVDHVGAFRLVDPVAWAEGYKSVGDVDSQLPREKPTYAAGVSVRFGPQGDGWHTLAGVAGKASSHFFDGSKAERMVRQGSSGFLRVDLGWELRRQGAWVGFHLFGDRAAGESFPLWDKKDFLGQAKLFSYHGGAMLTAGYRQ